MTEPNSCCGHCAAPQAKIAELDAVHAIRNHFCWSRTMGRICWEFEMAVEWLASTVEECDEQEVRRLAAEARRSLEAQRRGLRAHNELVPAILGVAAACVWANLQALETLGVPIWVKGKMW